MYQGRTSIDGDHLRGHLENLVLAVLQRGEAHGFEILHRLEAAGSGSLRLKEGSLYPALYRLERRGLVVGRWESEHSPRRGPRRHVYRLTTKGRRRLGAARSQFADLVVVIGGILGVKA